MNNETTETTSESGRRPGVSADRGVLVAQLLPPIFAVGATIVLRFLVDGFADEQGYVRALLLPGDSFFEWAVPLATMLLFFWSVCDLTLKLRSVNRQQRSLSHEALGRCAPLVRDGNIEEAIRGLNRAQESDKRSYVFQTMGSLLEHLRSANDPQRSHEFIRHQFDFDSENTDSSYSVVRLFIWAMPILGFIGTVVGIGMAVGDFSGFLSGNIDDIEVVKQELAKVTTGLAFAFNTTLLGLLTSLFAMLMTTYVQGRNEMLARAVEELCLRVIAIAPHEQNETVTGAGTVDSGLLLQSMQAFTEMIGTESERLRGGFDAFSARFLEVGNRISDTYAGLGAALEEQAAVSASRMQESATLMANALADACGAFSETTAALSRDLESFAPDLGGMKNAIVAGLDRMDRYNSQFEEVLRTTTREVVDAQEKLGVRIAEGLKRMDLSNTQFEEALRANAQQVFASHEKLGAVLAEGIGRVDQSNRQFGEALLSNAQQVVASQEKLGEKVGGALLSNAQQLVDTQERLGEQVRQLLLTNTQQVVESQGKLGDKVDGALLSSAQGIIDAQQKLGEQVGQLLRSSAQQVAGSQERLGEKLDGALLSTAQRLIDAQEKLGEQVREVLRLNAQQVVESHEKLGEKVETIRPTQEMMVQVAQSVRDSSGTLQQVRELHEALLPVLEVLSQPMELRMVPSVRKSGGDGE